MPLRRYIFNTLTVVSVVLIVGLGFDAYASELPLIYFSIGDGLAEETTVGHQIKATERFGFVYTVQTKLGVVQNRYFGIPHWFTATCLAILPALWLIKWNKRRKLGPNTCPACSYDLTGNESGKCPECGHASEPEDN